MHFYQILTLVIVTQAFCVGMFFYRHLDNKLRVILGLVSLALITEFSSQIIIHLFKGTTLWQTHFYVMFEFFFWALFYWYLMKPYVKRNLYWLVVVVFEIYCILNMTFIQELSEYTSTRAAESILIMVLSIIIYYRIMIEGKIEKLISEPIIWINTAVLIYFAASVFYHLLFNVLLVKNIEFLKLAGYFFIAANTLLYSLISVSFYLQKLKSVQK